MSGAHSHELPFKPHRYYFDLTLPVYISVHMQCILERERGSYSAWSPGKDG